MIQLLFIIIGLVSFGKIIPLINMGLYLSVFFGHSSEVILVY